MRDTSFSGNDVSFPIIVKATGKQPNLLFLELIKIKPKMSNKTGQCSFSAVSAGPKPNG